MSARPIARYVARDGDTVDWICWRHYADRGRLADGAVEAVLEANPGLADLGPRLAAGTVIRLPDLPVPQLPTIRLWD